MTGSPSLGREQPGDCDLVSALRDELVRDAAEPLTVRGPVYSLENSDIYYAECGRFESPLAIKLCKVAATGRPDRAAASGQYRALERVASKMTSLEYGVPRPIGLIENRGIVITEWIRGDSLTRILQRRGCDRETALDLVRRAGTWLRLFHSCHPLQPGKLDVREKVAAIHATVREQGRRPRMVSDAVRLLEASSDRTGSIELRKSWLHGDYKTDNLLLAGRRMIGLDVHVKHESVVQYDVAAFLNRLQLTLLHPSALRLRRHGPVFEEGFLDESLRADAAPTALPLAWIRLYMILCSWFGQATRDKSWPRRWYLELCFRRLTRQRMRDLTRLVA